MTIEDLPLTIITDLASMFCYETALVRAHGTVALFYFFIFFYLFLFIYFNFFIFFVLFFVNTFIVCVCVCVFVTFNS